MDPSMSALLKVMKLSDWSDEKWSNHTMQTFQGVMVVEKPDDSKPAFAPPEQLLDPPPEMPAIFKRKSPAPEDTKSTDDWTLQQFIDEMVKLAGETPIESAAAGDAELPKPGDVESPNPVEPDVPKLVLELGPEELAMLDALICQITGHGSKSNKREYVRSQHPVEPNVPKPVHEWTHEEKARVEAGYGSCSVDETDEAEHVHSPKPMF
jgi:hypothetical protein